MPDRVLTRARRGTCRVPRGVDTGAVADVIMRVGADIVMLQEIQRGQAARLAAAVGMPGHRWAFKHWAIVTERRGCRRAHPAPAGRGAVVRAAAGAVLELAPPGGARGHVRAGRAAVHCRQRPPLAARRRRASRPGSRARPRPVGTACRPPPVIGGDLNDPPGGPGYEAFTAAGWIDAWRAVHGDDELGRRHQLDRRSPARPAADPAPRLRARAARLARRELHRRRSTPRRLDDASALSDHLPVAATLRPPAPEDRAVNEQAVSGGPASGPAPQGAQAARQGRGHRQPARGRGVLGQGGGADRRPSHRRRSARRRPRPRRARGSAASRSAAAPTSGPGSPCSRRSPARTTPSSSGKQGPTAPPPCSLASRPTSTRSSCCTSRCTSRRPPRWPRSAGPPRPRPSGGGGRSSSASRRASRRCWMPPASGPRAGARPSSPPARRRSPTSSPGPSASGRTPPRPSGGWSPRRHRDRRSPRAGTTGTGPPVGSTSGGPDCRSGGPSVGGPMRTAAGRSECAGDRGREAVYAAEEAAFGGTIHEERRSLAELQERARTIVDGDWWRRAGGPAVEVVAARQHGPIVERAARRSPRRRHSPGRRPTRRRDDRPRARPSSWRVIDHGHDDRFRAAHLDVVALLAGPRAASMLAEAYAAFGLSAGRRAWPRAVARLRPRRS